MAAFIDAKGNQHQIQLNVQMYAAAADKGMSLPQFLATTYPTDTSKFGSVFAQILESEGIFTKPDRSIGIRPSTMAEMFGGAQAGTIVKDGVPASRILFPAVFLQMVEDKLVGNLTQTADAFESMIAIDEGINGDRYEQPVVNFSSAEKVRSQGISQLAEPASMVTITTSDKAYRIPGYALGLEVSDQALRASTIDFVSLAVARQAAIERNERAQGYLTALWNGDVDEDAASLSSLGLVKNATFFDSAATGGQLTQKAWMKYLMLNGTKRTISHLVCDIDTALKIENRTGKPVVSNDDSKTSRFDTQFSVMNPTWAKNPQIFLTEDPNWAANTVMGLDSRWAVRRVQNLSVAYQAIESFVMRRSTQMRMDFSVSVNRLFTDAFAGLTLL